MTAVDARVPTRTPAMDTAAGRAASMLAVRQVRRNTLVVTALVAGMSALVAGTYRSTVGDSLDAAALAALAQNPAIRTLFGEPVALDDPGGFTVWRTGTVVAVLTGVWALLTATRITRGEEDTGRWDLLLAGPLPVTTVLARHLAVLAAAPLLVGAAAAAALVAAGTGAHGAVLHGVGIALVGVFFAAAATLAAQIFPTRSAASGATVALLCAGLLLRMVGDGVASLGWLRWLSPFGLVAVAGPYHANRVVPLLVLALAAAVLLAAVPAAAARRDVRGGLLTTRSQRRPRLGLLRSTWDFAVRRLLPSLAGWAAGIGAYYLLIGLLAVSMTRFLADNPRFADLAAQAGFGGLGSVEGFAAALSAVLALPTGVFVAARVAVTAADETSGRLTPLYAQPITRRRLLTAELAATAGGAVTLTATAGLATWTGSSLVDAKLGLGAALAGTFNVLPIVALCIGAAAFALGWAPRAVALIGSLPAVGGFLLQVIAVSVDAPPWVGRLSPFAHLAAVPDVSPDWRGAAGMLATATAFAVAGMLGYQRRDLRG